MMNMPSNILVKLMCLMIIKLFFIIYYPMYRSSLHFKDLHSKRKKKGKSGKGICDVASYMLRYKVSLYWKLTDYQPSVSETKPQRLLFPSLEHLPRQLRTKNCRTRCSGRCCLSLHRCSNAAHSERDRTGYQ